MTLEWTKALFWLKPKEKQETKAKTDKGDIKIINFYTAKKTIKSRDNLTKG